MGEKPVRGRSTHFFSPLLGDRAKDEATKKFKSEIEKGRNAHLQFNLILHPEASPSGRMKAREGWLINLPKMNGVRGRGRPHRPGTTTSSPMGLGARTDGGNPKPGPRSLK